MAPKKIAKGKKEQEGSKSTRPVGEVGAISELPVLRYTENVTENNFQAFKEALELYALREFGDLGLMIENEEYWVPPTVKLPNPAQFSPENDPGGFKAHHYKTLIAERSKKIAQMESMHSRLYSVILGQLSTESKTRMRQSVDDWNKADESRDPLKLWKLVIKVHSVGAIGDKALDYKNIRDAYTALKQGSTEALADYYLRFVRSIERFEALNYAKPTDEMQAVDFIHGLDAARYASFATELENSCRVFGTVTYPKNLSDAFDMASRYKVVQSTSSTSGATVFVTTADTLQNHPAKSKKQRKSEGNKQTKPKDSGDKEKQSKKKKQSEPKKKYCTLCQQEGHWPKDCEWLVRCRETITCAKNTTEQHSACVTDGVIFAADASEDIVLASALSRLGRYEVLLDNQASVHIFKESELLTDLRECGHTLSVSGIAAGTNVTSNTVGHHPLFGEVYYCPEAKANILCYALVRDRYDVDYDQDTDAFVVKVNPQQELQFKRRDNIYPCDFTDLTAERCFITTVEQNESMYTKREVLQAKRAQELSAQLGYPSAQDLIEMINHGSIINVPVTARDVQRAHAIYGPDLASVKGKTTSKKPHRANTDTIVKTVRQVQILSTDIMFVNGDPFLVSVSAPLGLTTVNHLGGKRNFATVRDALFEQLNIYKSEGFDITTILTDGEGAVSKLTTLLRERGIRVNPTGAGQHVANIERKIRVIKERCRGIYNTLPFKLNKELTKWMVYYAVSRVNLLPSTISMSRVSPREQFTGRKADYNLDVRVAFGQYCQVHVPDSADKNSMKARTDGAIALLPTGNLQGSVKFLSLSTGKIVTRDHWTALPMPENVIIHLNNMSATNWKEGDELTFSIGDAIIAADDAKKHDALSVPEEETHSGIHSGNLSVGGNDDVNGEAAPVPAHENIAVEAHVEEPPAEECESVGIENNAVSQQPGAEPTTEPNCGSDKCDETVDAIDDSAADDVNTIPIDNEQQQHRYSLRKRLEKAQRDARIRERREYCSLHITVRKGIQKFGKKALDAVLEELQQMLAKKVFHPVHAKQLSAPRRKKIIRSSIFLKEKFNSNGIFVKLKARLVAGGHMQDKSLYNDNSSPTVATQSVFMVSTIAAKERRIVVTADIGGAYLNASMGNIIVDMKLDAQMSTLLVELDESYREYLDERGEITVQLDKALYGCIESAKLWYLHLKKTLESLGFISNPNDPCVFNRGSGEHQCTICVHVDDLMITCKDQETIDEVLSNLVAVYQDVQVSRGSKHSYLGMTFDFGVEGKSVITMEGYIHDLLVYYDTKTTSATPATANLFAVSDSEPLGEYERVEFHSGVAKLLYLAKRVRPEILTAVSFLASRVSCATVEDKKKFDRVLSYLNSEPDLGLTLESDEEIQVHAYVDASFGVHSDGKSHTGGVISLGGGPTYVKSTKQKLVSKSSTEAELIGLSDMLSNIIWHREFLQHQGYVMSAANIYEDNTSAITLAEKGRSTSERTRHVNVRYFFIKDRIEKKEVKINYLPTTDMIADILTKPLQGELFRRLRDKLLNCVSIRI